MSAPEKIWIEDEFGEGHEDQWQYGSWDCRNAYDYVHEYIRADIADARVAAAYEAAAITAKSDGESEWFNPVRAIRALTPDDAKATLEAVRREARAEALQEVRRIAYDAKDLCEAGQPLIALNLANQILALTLRRPQNDRPRTTSRRERAAAWQPIDNITPDAGHVLLLGSTRHDARTIFTGWIAQNGMIYGDAWGLDCKPTHWMPLPPPPAGENGND